MRFFCISFHVVRFSLSNDIKCSSKDRSYQGPDVEVLYVGT